MSVPSSGILYFGKLGKELEYNNYNSGTTPPFPIGLQEMSTGNYSGNAINNGSTSHPNNTTPHGIDEFYGYDHDASSGNGGA